MQAKKWLSFVNVFLIGFFTLSLFFNCHRKDIEVNIDTTTQGGGTDFSRPGGNTSQSTSVSADTDEEELVKKNEEKWGESAMIKPRSIGSLILEDFRLGHPIDKDDIDAIAVYVELQKSSQAKTYEGQITLSFRKGNEQETRQFISGSNRDARYNVWVKKGGTTFFHGFFQEKGKTPPPSSLILVLDHRSPNQDPDNPNDDKWGGSVWFMTFRQNLGLKTGCQNRDAPYIYSHPNPSQFSLTKSKCWFEETGPFNCRAWKRGDGVDTFRRAEPEGVCYSKFGTFEGLDISKAFDVSNFEHLQMHTR